MSVWALNYLFPLFNFSLSVASPSSIRFRRRSITDRQRFNLLTNNRCRMPYGVDVLPLDESSRGLFYPQWGNCHSFAVYRHVAALAASRPAMTSQSRATASISVIRRAADDQTLKGATRRPIFVCLYLCLYLCNLSLSLFLSLSTSVYQFLSIFASVPVLSSLSLSISVSNSVSVSVSVSNLSLFLPLFMFVSLPPSRSQSLSLYLRHGLSISVCLSTVRSTTDFEVIRKNRYVGFPLFGNACHRMEFASNDMAASNLISFLYCAYIH